jgi:hypothetical protein
MLTFLDEVEGNEPWKADDSHDDYWGADETDYWAQREAEQKALAKTKRSVAQKPHSRHVNQLKPEFVELEQPSIHNMTLMGEIEEALQTPLPLTYTAINSSTDTSTPENKRRLFQNLHRQLTKEVEKARTSGGWMSIPPDVLKEAQKHAEQPAEHWEDLDVTLFEPRIRELVKLLIAKRREMQLM